MLDNGGWSMKEMLTLCLVLILAAVISHCVYVETFGNNGIVNRNFGNDTTTDSSTSSDTSNDKNNTSSDTSSNDSDDTSVKDTTIYTNHETSMVAASNKYIKNQNIDSADISVYYIKLSTLVKDNYIDEIKDGNVKCSGYVKITETSKTAYLKCPNYETSGYDSEYDGNN